MSNHARIRALERYGLHVNVDDFRAISEQITEGQARKLGFKGRRTSIYVVHVQGREAIIVYNRAAKITLTFLPIEDWKR